MGPDSSVARHWGRRLGYELVTLGAFAVREYRIWQSYRVNQIMWLANIFVTTLL